MITLGNNHKWTENRKAIGELYKGKMRLMTPETIDQSHHHPKRHGGINVMQCKSETSFMKCPCWHYRSWLCWRSNFSFTGNRGDRELLTTLKEWTKIQGTRLCKRPDKVPSTNKLGGKRKDGRALIDQEARDLWTTDRMQIVLGSRFKQANWKKKLYMRQLGQIWILTQFSSVQSLSRVRLFATQWITAPQASQSITNSQGSLKLTSIELVMLSSHLILCRPLVLLTSIPPRMSLFQWVNSSHEVAKVLEFQL